MGFRITLTGSVAVSVLVAAPGAQSSWEEREIAKGVGGVFDLACGDLDGDGDEDVVAAGSEAGGARVDWFELRAEGELWTEGAVASGLTDLTAIAVGDVNGDGARDVLTCSSDDLDWYENLSGDGSAWSRHTIASSALLLARAVTGADVDGDGDLDAVVGTFSIVGKSVIWYENIAGDGSSWTAHGIATTAFEANAVVAVDLDRDGDRDFVAASGPEQRIVWLENTTGDGAAWSEHLMLAGKAGVSSIDAADLDCDGDVDAAFTSSTAGEVSWLANDGTGVVWTESPIAVGVSGPQQALALDVDGDGDSDVAVASEDDDTVAWYDNTAGDGSLWTQALVSSTVSGALVLLAGDVDGDAGLDLISAAGTSETLAWHENPEGIAAEVWSDTTASMSLDSPVVDVAAADIDGDGDLDGVSSTQFDDRLAWFENVTENAENWFQHNISRLVPLPLGVEAGDLDGDGDQDVLTGTRLNDEILWFENAAGDGTAWSSGIIQSQPFIDFPTAVAAADFDGDDDQDLLVSSRNRDEIAWFENLSADGSAWEFHLIARTTEFPLDVFAADVDGDGDQDALSASFKDSSITWFENVLGDGSLWTETVISVEEAGAEAVYAADLDGDGDIDALSASQRADRVVWHENVMGDGTVWAEHVLSLEAFLAQDVFAMDVDGDGDEDVVTAATGGGKLSWFENVLGDGSLWVEAIVSIEADFPRAIEGADVENDGDVDIVFAGLALDLYENADGAGGIWMERSIGSIVGPAPPDTGDLDGDGDLDVVSGDSFFREVDWFENVDGDGMTWTTHVIDNVSVGQLQEVVAVDVDGDGDCDIPIVSTLQEELSWYENLSGDGASWSEVLVADREGVAGSVESLEVADLDADGDLDTLVASSVDDRIIWYENSGDGSAWTFSVVSLATDFTLDATAADVDGDGDLDVVAAELGAGDFTWYENLTGDASSWSDALVIDSSFGSPRIVATGDLDGDGDLDAMGSASFVDLVTWFENSDGVGRDWSKETLAEVSGPQEFRAADIDLDGDADVVVSALFELSWYENFEGDGSVWLERNILPEYSDSNAVGDFDADGDPDVLSGVDDRVAVHVRSTPVVFYGCVNPEGSLRLLDGTPAVGTTLVLGVDNPLGTQAAGAVPALFRSLAPDPAFPCGTSIPGFGMAGPGASGEILLSLLPGDLIPGQILGPGWIGPGCPAPIQIDVPNDTSLCGLAVYFQAAMIDAAAFGVPIGLTNGVQLTIDAR